MLPVADLSGLDNDCGESTRDSTEDVAPLGGTAGFSGKATLFSKIVASNIKQNLPEQLTDDEDDAKMGEKLVMDHDWWRLDNSSKSTLTLSQDFYILLGTHRTQYLIYIFSAHDGAKGD